MGKPDVLTRRSGDEKSGAEERMFKEGQLHQIDDTKAKADSGDKLQVIKDVVPADLLALDGINPEDVDMEAQDIALEGIDCAAWERNADGLLKVPEEYKKEVLRQCHDSKVAGHWDRHRTQELVSRDFIWDGWREDVTRYVASYQRCQRSKSDRHARQTKLIPMPRGNRP